jgi:DNA-directed RNA polymerase specialized sigma24 family protein
MFAPQLTAMDHDTPILSALRSIAAHRRGKADRTAVEREWSVVISYVTERAHKMGARGLADELVQTVVLKVLPAVPKLRANTEGEARSWLNAITRNALTDLRRAAQRELGRSSGMEPEDVGVVPYAEQEEKRDRAEIGERLWHFVQAHIDGPDVKAFRRRKTELHAMACVLRIRERASADEIKKRLDEPDMKDSLVDKWVERGREVVLAALEVWKQTADEHELDDVKALVEMFSKRRRDAGQPRPARRKKAAPRGRNGGRGRGKSRRFVSSPTNYPSVQYGHGRYCIPGIFRARTRRYAV